MTALLTESQGENQETRLIPPFCPTTLRLLSAPMCVDSQRAGVGGELFDRAGQRATRAGGFGRAGNAQGCAL